MMQVRSRRRLKIVLIVGLVLLGASIMVAGGLFVTVLAIFGHPTNDADNANPTKQQEMLRIILDVCQLAPIPKNAQITQLKTEGNLFAREFRLSFQTDPAALRKWVDASKGARLGTVTKSAGIKSYDLELKKGYNYGEMVVDFRNGTAKVHLELN